MSSKLSYVLGYHGTDKEIGLNILLGNDKLKHSQNDYDWLGHGVYFWENDPQRAKQFAIEASPRAGSTIKTPFALGAIIDLGNCFDLLEQENLNFLAYAYGEFIKKFIRGQKPIPQNSSFTGEDFDFKKRDLDCAVIRFALELAEELGEKYDSVRAAFLEGKPLYSGAGFKEKNHIQISVINPKCIKGIFLPQ